MLTISWRFPRDVSCQWEPQEPRNLQWPLLSAVSQIFLNAHTYPSLRNRSRCTWIGRGRSSVVSFQEKSTSTLHVHLQWKFTFWVTSGWQKKNLTLNVWLMKATNRIPRWVSLKNPNGICVVMYLVSIRRHQDCCWHLKNSRRGVVSVKVQVPADCWIEFNN